MSEEKKYRTKSERQQAHLEARLDRLLELRGENIDDVTGYVYRENWGSGKVSLPPIQGVLEDHEFGIHFGPGRYSVVYRFIDLDQETKGEEDFKPKNTTIIYQIGPEYAELHREDCRINNRQCYIDSKAIIPGMEPPKESVLASILNEDKIKGLVGLLGAVKLLLGNKDGSEDLRMMLTENTKLLQTALGGSRKNESNSFPEKIMEISLNRLLENKPDKSPREQLKDQMEMFSMVRDLANPEAAETKRAAKEESMKGPLEKMVDKAMDILPVFLERFNGDERKAAQAVQKENPMAKLLLSSKDAQEAFYRSTSRQYGSAAADRWAQGFGIDPSRFQPAAQTVSAPVHSDVIQLG
jgi:hypothetical protein